MTTAIGIILCTSTPFLLLFGEYLLNRIWYRGEGQ